MKKTCLHIFLIAFVLSLSPAPFAPAHAAQPEQTKDQAAQAKKKKRKKDQDMESQSMLSPLDLKLIAVSKVEDVRPNGQIVLENGKTVLLDNIRIPVPLQETATAKLKQLLKGLQIGLYVSPATPVGTYTDKVGNIIAHVMTEKGAWVQSLLVGNGYAWVDTSPTKSGLLYSLYRYEERAMQMNAGLWAMPEFSIKNVNDIKNSIGSYQVFEGIVVRCSFGKPPYIAFGKTQGDFTALLSEDIEHDISERTGLSDREMIGQKLRIHGWVEDKNGPAMVIRQADQIEIIHVFLPTLNHDAASQKAEDKKQTTSTPTPAPASAPAPR